METGEDIKQITKGPINGKANLSMVSGWESLIGDEASLPETAEGLEENVVKICMLGGGGVGSKTGFMVRLMTNKLTTEYDPTIEDTYASVFKIGNSAYLVEILDTAGQEEYACMRDMYMYNYEAFLLGYDITKRSSFDQVSTFYEQICKIKDTNQFSAVLVGNKKDLENSRDVTYDEGHELAKKWNVPFFETSNLTGENVLECFSALIKLTVSRKLAARVTPEEGEHEEGEHEEEHEEGEHEKGEHEEGEHEKVEYEEVERETPHTEV